MAERDMDTFIAMLTRAGIVFKREASVHPKKTRGSPFDRAATSVVDVIIGMPDYNEEFSVLSFDAVTGALVHITGGG